MNTSTVKITTIIFLLYLDSVSVFPKEKEIDFKNTKGAHPYYLNQTHGYNSQECKEKEKCIKNCPELPRKPGTSFYISKDREGCLRACNEMSCKLN